MLIKQALAIIDNVFFLRVILFKRVGSLRGFSENFASRYIPSGVARENRVPNTPASAYLFWFAHSGRGHDLWGSWCIHRLPPLSLILCFKKVNRGLLLLFLHIFFAILSSLRNAKPPHVLLPKKPKKLMRLNDR